MKRFERDLILIGTRDTIDKLIILAKGQHIPTTIPSKKPVNERFKSRVHESVYKKLNPFRLPPETLDAIKFYKEISGAITIFEKTFEEIAKNGKFEFMLKVIEEQQKQNADEMEIIREYEEAYQQLKDLKKHYTEKISHDKIRLHAAEENLEELKSELRNIEKVNEIELLLVQKWEQTRLDQAETLRIKNEKELNEEIQAYKTKIEQERRKIIDTENYLNFRIEDYKKQILFWEDKYQTEMAELSAEAKKISKQIIQMQKKYEKHMDVYKEREKFINDYRERKAEEQRQFEIQQNRINSAIRLQAWWRGVMVRRCLGPFKKKKKKGKKGKKK